MGGGGGERRSEKKVMEGNKTTRKGDNAPSHKRTVRKRDVFLVNSFLGVFSFSDIIQYCMVNVKNLSDTHWRTTSHPIVHSWLIQHIIPLTV